MIESRTEWLLVFWVLMLCLGSLLPFYLWLRAYLSKGGLSTQPRQPSAASSEHGTPTPSTDTVSPRPKTASPHSVRRGWHGEACG